MNITSEFVTKNVQEKSHIVLEIYGEARLCILFIPNNSLNIGTIHYPQWIGFEDTQNLCLYMRNMLIPGDGKPLK